MTEIKYTFENEYFAEFLESLSITDEAITDCKQLGMGDVVAKQVNQEFGIYMMERYPSVPIHDVSEDINHFMSKL